MLKFVSLLFISILLFNCSSSEERFDKSFIKGTWTGTLNGSDIVEYKIYSPAVEDSLTKRTDSVYTIHDVLVDFGKEEVQFFGMRSIISSPHVYDWNGRDSIIFQKKMPHNDLLEDGSRLIVVNDVQMSYASIAKLDTDSLVMTLAVYNKDWKEYQLRLKRKR